MTIKYVIRPGTVQGSNGRCITCDAPALMKLYQVKPNECIILNNSDSNFEAKYSNYVSRRYIFLYPRSDENYSWLQRSTAANDAQQDIDVSA